MDKKLKTFGNNNKAQIASRKGKIANFNEYCYKNSTIINKLSKIFININIISINAKDFCNNNFNHNHNNTATTIARGLAKFKNDLYNNIYNYIQSIFETLESNSNSNNTHLNFSIFYSLATNFFTHNNITYFNSHKFSILNKIANFNYSTFYKNNFHENELYKNTFFENNSCYSLSFKPYNIQYTSFFNENNFNNSYCLSFKPFNIKYSSFFNENNCNNSYTKYTSYFYRLLANANIKGFIKVISYTSFNTNKLVLMTVSSFLITIAILKLIFPVTFHLLLLRITGGIFFYF
ncbi:MAG: hypothetical protein FWH29_07505 [Methanobrevibacter sp.]|nr:hypothetical protein [Methanobrevibacter sp.]